MLTNIVTNKESSCSWLRGYLFRLPFTAPLCSPPCSLDAHSLRPLAPSLLSLKRLCSLSRPGTVIVNPKFGVYIIDIYICTSSSSSSSFCSDFFYLDLGRTDRVWRRGWGRQASTSHVEIENSPIDQSIIKSELNSDDPSRESE